MSSQHVDKYLAEPEIVHFGRRFAMVCMQRLSKHPFELALICCCDEFSLSLHQYHQTQLQAVYAR